MLGPHDLEDFYSTVDQERDARRGASAEQTGAGQRRAFSPLRSFSVWHHLMAVPTPFGDFSSRG